MSRVLRRIAPALALAALIGAAAPDARAGVAVGDNAPDFEGSEFFNTEAVSLQALRGRLILFELFATW
jgi:hypothetical protein